MIPIPKSLRRTIGIWLAWIGAAVAAVGLAWMRGSRYKRKAEESEREARTVSRRADVAKEVGTERDKVREAQKERREREGTSRDAMRNHW